MRIGIFGGTFNPPHKGHKRMALEMMKSASLDKILIIPTFTPPHKTAPELAGTEDRMKMCELLFGEEEATVENFRLPRFLIYDAETDSIIEDTTVFEEPYRESFGESAFRKVINFFTALLNFLTDLFKNKK